MESDYTKNTKKNNLNPQRIIPPLVKRSYFASFFCLERDSTNTFSFVFSKKTTDFPEQGPEKRKKYI